jgi:hypothetical protein
MNAAQQAAAEAALAAWVAPMLQSASIFTRGSYQAFFDAHKDELVAVIGNAVAAIPSDPPAS